MYRTLNALAHTSHSTVSQLTAAPMKVFRCGRLRVFSAGAALGLFLVRRVADDNGNRLGTFNAVGFLVTRREGRKQRRETDAGFLGVGAPVHTAFVHQGAFDLVEDRGDAASVQVIGPLADMARLARLIRGLSA